MKAAFVRGYRYNLNQIFKFLHIILRALHESVTADAYLDGITTNGRDGALAIYDGAFLVAHVGTTPSVFNDGFRTFYNHIRRHQDLRGLTPAQAAGVDLNLGRNRWMGLIQKAAQHQRNSDAL